MNLIMRYSRTFLTAFILLLSLLTSGSLLAQPVQNRPYVILVSLDGFRWDYGKLYMTPNLDELARTGVKAEALIPSFPTKTFPNHYTIATGLYPDHHGIVNNSFYDPAEDRYYRISDRKAVGDGSFYGGEPIWVTAEKQHVRTASYFWVGTEAPIQGIQPTYWKPYDHRFPFEQRIDTAIYWLSLPYEKRPHLVLLYFSEPDEVGHHHGPESKETSRMVTYLDSLMGVLIQKTGDLPIADSINLIVLSDHGMGEITKKNTLFLHDYIRAKWFETIQGGSPVYNLKVNKGYEEKAYKWLNKAEHMQAWKHGEVPERFHYGNNPRTLDFTLVADSGWQIRTEPGFSRSKGDHGYDNADRDMLAIFYAKGPGFRQGYTCKAFSNTDIYALIAELLHLTPVKTDGSLEEVSDILNKYSNE